MKKIASILFILAVFSACSEDIKRNNPAVQGLKDDVMWRAAGVSATLGTNGSLTIEGVTQYETLTLKTNNTNEQVFVLGNSTARSASFIDTRNGDEIIYSTGVNIGDGQIEITDYDEANMTVTGTFRFNAVNESEDAEAGEVLNFNQGNFYKVPVVPAL
ncbi:MAG TPA: DUF6252 family protein [Flavobacterium sp.]|jgi:hypothetical protein